MSVDDAHIDIVIGEDDEVFRQIVDEIVQESVDEAVQEHLPDPTMATSSFGEDEAVGLARRGVGAAQNPESMLTSLMSSLPHAAALALAMQLIPIIIEELTKKGGPFDLSWRRFMEKEFNALMDRQTAYDLNVGERGLIIQTKAGFINRLGKAGNTNNLRMIREGGVDVQKLNELGYVDHSKGLF